MHSGNFSFCKCEKCNGDLRIIKPKNFKPFIGCSSYPNCNTFISFSSYVVSVIIL
jgi:ssDNA-binding Zn-finger/Zn-ribbon topoisomerase 1